jgi:hypothetical protein
VKALIVWMAILAAQMDTSIDRPVVHLRPHSDAIDMSFDGRLLELINAPPVIHLPTNSPRFASNAAQWTIEIKNFGPGAVTVVDAVQFCSVVSVGGTVRIEWNGISYTSKPQ